MIAPVPQSRLSLLGHALMPERAALKTHLCACFLLVSYTASSVGISSVGAFLAGRDSPRSASGDFLLRDDPTRRLTRLRTPLVIFW